MVASISGANTIVLRGDYGEHEEGKLLVAASPGMNVVLAANFSEQERDCYTVGGTDYIGTGTGVTTTKAPIKILKEDALQGRTVDDAYSAGDPGFIYIPKPGDKLQVLVASGQTIVKGGGLSATSTGKWQADTTNAAVEALEDSGGALSEDTLVRVRVI